MKKSFKNTVKKAQFSTETERYVYAAKLLATRPEMTSVEALRTANVSLPEFIELAKQVKGAYADVNGKAYSEAYKRQRQIDKFLLLAELVK